jgi:two-component system sensor histidine kinase BaeS
VSGPNGAGGQREPDGPGGAGGAPPDDWIREQSRWHDDPSGPDGRHDWYSWSRHQRSAARRAARGEAKRSAWEARFEARWRSRHYPKPTWWPENEPWPPQGEFPWRRMRRLFFIRFAIGIALVFALVVAGPLIVLGEVLRLAGVSGAAATFGAVAIFVVLMIAIAAAARGARRFALPVGSLIEAAGHVEDGDYSARVPEYGHGPRELRALVAAFNSMAARLEEDERQRRTLLADVSHELRTPLAVLRGELEAMIDGIHPADEAHLSAAVDDIAMLTGLVEDLGTLALAEAGTLALHFETTDLSVLTHEVAASFESLAAKSDARLAVRMPDDLPLVELDPLRIRQVLGNLVANALRYTPAGSEVAISAERSAPNPETGDRTGSAGRAASGTGVPTEDRVAISVVDQGPGIAPEVLPHLFDRFAKSSDSRGSGLGLAIARRLVEAHGGSISAERPPQGGTAVRFELPVSRSRQPGS